MTSEVMNQFPPVNLPPFFKYFWIAFIAVILINLWIAWQSLRGRIQKDPDMEAGYRRLLLGFSFWGSFPWLLMGLGITWGGVSSPWEYLVPSQGKPMVLAWWGTMALLGGWFIFWIFNGGAEKLEKYPGLPMIPATGAKKIKLFALIGVGWNVLIGAVLFSGFPFSSDRDVWARLGSLMPAIFPFLFVGMWLLVSWILSHTSGWVSLADLYRTDEPFNGKGLLTSSGQFGLTRYNGVLKIGADSDGLYLSLIFIFRFSHSPLFIRWSDIKLSEQKCFFNDWVSIEFNNVPGVVLKIRKKDVLKLKMKAETSQVFEGIS